MTNTHRYKEDLSPCWVDHILEKKSMAFNQFGFPVAQTVKNLPAMHETGIPSLGQKDPLEKKVASHSRIFAWEISWTEKPGRLQSMGSQ